MNKYTDACCSYLLADDFQKALIERASREGIMNADIFKKIKDCNDFKRQSMDEIIEKLKKGPQ